MAESQEILVADWLMSRFRVAHKLLGVDTERSITGFHWCRLSESERERARERERERECCRGYIERYIE